LKQDRRNHSKATKVIARRPPTFLFTPGFSRTLVDQQATLRISHIAAGGRVSGISITRAQE
jgi:hypothetical protein